MDKETFEILSDPMIINSTDDQEFNYVSYQYGLAHEWLKSIKRCKCELDETSGNCRHIRRALRKLYGQRIDKIWNRNLKKKIDNFSAVTGFKIPYDLQKELSA